VSAAQAGFGEAQITATVTAKSCPGQGRKHYIWYGLTLDRARLNTQCSICLQMGWGRTKGGEKRESQISLTQVEGKDNGDENQVVGCFEIHHSEAAFRERTVRSANETMESTAKSIGMVKYHP
jgi:hypothetical protein